MDEQFAINGLAWYGIASNFDGDTFDVEFVLPFHAKTRATLMRPVPPDDAYRIVLPAPSTAAQMISDIYAIHRREWWLILFPQSRDRLKQACGCISRID